MRTLASELTQALESGSYSVYFNCKVYTTTLYGEFQPIKYKLTGMNLSITVYGIVPQSTSIMSVEVELERGVTISGVNYGVTTSKFTVVDGFTKHFDSTSVISEIICSLIPPIYVDFLADTTYEAVITAYCTAIGKTATFKNSTIDFWQQQFYITGQRYISEDARDFLSVLNSKLVYCCDNGNDDILFYYALDVPVSTDYGITSVLPPMYGTGMPLRRRFYALDEFSNPRSAGTATDPVYDLGFISSLDPMPTTYTQSQPFKSTPMPVHLKYQSGDYVNWNSGTLTPYPIEVTENFNKDSTKLKFNVELSQLEYFNIGTNGNIVRIVSEIPVNADNGDLIYNTSNNTFYIYINGIWVPIGTGDLNTYAILLENNDFCLLENDDILLQG